MVGGIGRRGLMLVLSSPSGGGKTTLTRRLLEQDSNVMLSISVTTRAPRPGEVNGIHYHFIDQARYDALKAENALLESAVVYGAGYGTPRAPVEAALASGRDVLFDIDWQGTQQLARNARDDLASIFVLPPSAEELERRLRDRGQDPEEVIRKRMAKASDEISHWVEYDYVIVNSDADDAVLEVRAILEAERRKRRRQNGLAAFVKSIQAATPAA